MTHALTARREGSPTSPHPLTRGPGPVDVVAVPALVAGEGWMQSPEHNLGLLARSFLLV